MTKRDYDRDPVVHALKPMTPSYDLDSLCGARNVAPRFGPVTCKLCLRCLAKNTRLTPPPARGSS